MKRFVTNGPVAFLVAGLFTVVFSCATAEKPVSMANSTSAPSASTETIDIEPVANEPAAVPVVSLPIDPLEDENILSGSFAEPESPLSTSVPPAGAVLDSGAIPTVAPVAASPTDAVLVPIPKQPSAPSSAKVPTGGTRVPGKNEALSPVLPSPEPALKTSDPPAIPAEKESDLSRVPVPVPASALPELPARIAPSTVEEPVLYSRKVRATVGQLVEVPFKGTGWVFLGELGSRKGLPYDSRRLDPEGQSFVFRAEATGIFTLKFYKQDFIQDYILNDYVQVTIAEPPELTSIGGFSAPRDRGRIIAEPRWPLSGSGSVVRNSATVQAEPVAAPVAAAGAVEAAPAADIVAESLVTPAIPKTIVNAAESANTGSSVPQSSSSVPPGVVTFSADALPEEYLDRARKEYEAGTVGTALQVLDIFRERFPAGSDEAWWLYGKVLESSGPSRDIKSALGFYKRLVSEYPQSSRYAEAKKRIAYLERYYFDIR